MGWKDAPAVQEGQGAARWQDAPTVQPSASVSAAAPAVKPPPRLSSGDDSALGFVLGNLNKGITGLMGLPVDTISGAINLSSMAQNAATQPFRRAMGMGPGNWQPPIQNPAYGSRWIEEQWRRKGAITPAADPTSTAGRYGAAVLQMAPSAMLARPTSIPQTTRALGATTTSSLGGEVARDIGGDEWAPAGAMLAGGRTTQNKRPQERIIDEVQGRRFDKAKEMGIPVPPREMKVDKSQVRLQEAALKDLPGLPQGTEITPETLSRYNAAQWNAYENIIKSPALKQGVVPNQKFQQEIQTIGSELERARAELPETFKGMRPVLKLLGEYGYAAPPPGAPGIRIPPRQQPIPADIAMRAVKKLRSDAAKNFTSENPQKVELAHTQKRVASAIEDLIGDNLKDPAAMKSFQDARTAIAKSHDLQAALDPVTKQINPKKLAAMQAEGGGRLTGNLKDIADVTSSFPGAAKPPKESDELFTKRVTPMAVTHPSAAGAHWLTRMWDPITTSRPYQDVMVDPRAKLSPAQQRLIRLFSASRAGQQQDIPTPP